MLAEIAEFVVFRCALSLVNLKRFFGSKYLSRGIGILLEKGRQLLFWLFWFLDGFLSHIIGNLLPHDLKLIEPPGGAMPIDIAKQPPIGPPFHESIHAEAKEPSQLNKSYDAGIKFVESNLASCMPSNSQAQRA